MSETRKRVVWTELDENVLLTLWAKRTVDFQREKRHAYIFDEISLEMGDKFSPREVYVKIRNMTQRYRDEKRKGDTSDGSPSKWKHYITVHNIIEGEALGFTEKRESFSSYSTVKESSHSLAVESARVEKSLLTLNSASLSSSSAPSTPLPSPQSFAAKRKRTVWTKLDNKILFKLWAKRAVDLQRKRQKGRIYGEIASEMGENFNAREVFIKIRNLKRRYCDEKKNVDTAEGSPSKWKHYKTVHEILDRKPVNGAQICESISLHNTLSESSQSLVTESATVEESLLTAKSTPAPLPPPSAHSPFSPFPSAAVRKRAVWTKQDNKIIFKLWAKRAADLQGEGRKGRIYGEISSEMGEKFNAREVFLKIRNLKQRYCDERKIVDTSGGHPSKWNHYMTVHDIIARKPVNGAQICESVSLHNTLSESSQSLGTESATAEESLLTAMTTRAPSPPPSVLLASPSAPSTPSTSPPPTASADPFVAPVETSENNSDDMIKIMREQTEMLRSVIENTNMLTKEIVTAIREQKETTNEFLELMRTFVDKM